MKNVSVIGALAMAAVAGSALGQNALINGGFEDTCTPALGWTKFGNVENINFYTTSGARSIKMFGPFCCPTGYSGIYQDVAAEAGQTWKGGAFVFSPCWDRLRANGTRAFVSVDFLDADGNFLNPFQAHISPKQNESTVPGGNATCDLGEPWPEPVPTYLETTSAVAPAGTASVRITLYVEQENFIGGAAWWDDAYLERADQPGVNQAINTSFEEGSPNCFGSPFQGWHNFGNGQGNFGENARNGNYAAKLFGGFNGNPAYSGWFQNVPATPGTKWKARGYARSWVNDSLRPGNNVWLGIEFIDAFNNNLVGMATRSGNVPTPGDDIYRLYETGVATAPPETAFVRCVILQEQFDFQGGATWWDDMELFEPCAADFNGDGFVDFFDFDDFVICFEGGACPPGQSADFNGDGFADFFDYDDFVAAFETGCP